MKKNIFSVQVPGIGETWSIENFNLLYYSADGRLIPLKKERDGKVLTPKFSKGSILTLVASNKDGHSVILKGKILEVDPKESGITHQRIMVEGSLTVGDKESDNANYVLGKAVHVSGIRTIMKTTHRKVAIAA